MTQLTRSTALLLILTAPLCASPFEQDKETQIRSTAQNAQKSIGRRSDGLPAMHKFDALTSAIAKILDGRTYRQQDVAAAQTLLADFTSPATTKQLETEARKFGAGPHEISAMLGMMRSHVATFEAVLAHPLAGRLAGRKIDAFVENEVQVKLKTEGGWDGNFLQNWLVHELIPQRITQARKQMEAEVLKRPNRAGALSDRESKEIQASVEAYPALLKQMLVMRFDRGGD